MHEENVGPIEDTDKIHTLPLSVLPLKSRALKRARLVKNSRLESMVELFSGKESGSGQVSVADLAQIFDFSGEEKSDLVIVKKLGGLASYDVYSLRIELRQLEIDVENVEHLTLSVKKIAELSTYMQAFTKPLLAAMYGTHYDHPRDFRQILKLLSDPDDAVTRQRLYDIVNQLNIGLKALPDFLERYGDVYLSLAYYKQCLDLNKPYLEEIHRTIGEIRKCAQFKSDEFLHKSCDIVGHKLITIAGEVTHILDVFEARTADMWEDISAAKYHANSKLVLDYQTKIGGALCALTVKAAAWAEMFPRGEASSIYQRANFIGSELKVGLESVERITYHDPDAVLRP